MYLSWIGQFDTFFWHSYVSFSMDNLFGNLFYAFQVKYVKTNCYWNCCLGLFNKPYQRWVSPKQLSIPLNKLRWSDLIRSVPDTCGIFKICTAFVLHFVRYLYGICYLIRYKKKGFIKIIHCVMRKNKSYNESKKTNRCLAVGGRLLRRVFAAPSVLIC